jgi:hypothetical protein
MEDVRSAQVQAALLSARNAAKVTILSQAPLTVKAAAQQAKDAPSAMLVRVTHANRDTPKPTTLPAPLTSCCQKVSLILHLPSHCALMLKTVNNAIKVISVSVMNVLAAT